MSLHIYYNLEFTSDETNTDCACQSNIVWQIAVVFKYLAQGALTLE